jgi:hypothetical protein
VLEALSPLQEPNRMTMFSDSIVLWHIATMAEVSGCLLNA